MSGDERVDLRKLRVVVAGRGDALTVDLGPDHERAPAVLLELDVVDARGRDRGTLHLLLEEDAAAHLLAATVALGQQAFGRDALTLAFADVLGVPADRARRTDAAVRAVVDAEREAGS